MWTFLLIYMMYSVGHYVDCYFVDLHDVYLPRITHESSKAYFQWGPV
jgi:hypothetical protein